MFFCQLSGKLLQSSTCFLLIKYSSQGASPRAKRDGNRTGTRIQICFAKFKFTPSAASVEVVWIDEGARDEN